jgi:hypothetical protein
VHINVVTLNLVGTDYKLHSGMSKFQQKVGKLQYHLFTTKVQICYIIFNLM